ncbi:Inovirus Gp2 family protein [Vibrio crassostreae]|nr:Inovirus Gp2 family protein [Vibrio crassostreae]
MNTQDSLRQITYHLEQSKTESQSLIAFTVLAERDLYQSAIESGSDTIDHLAKNLKRHLRRYGIDSSQMWFVLEDSGIKVNLKNPHIHGLILIDDHQREDLKKALQKSLGRASRLMSPFKQRTKTMHSLGWVDYCCKHLERNARSIGRSPVFISQKLRKLKVPTFGKTYTCENSDEASDSKDLSEFQQNHCSVGISTLINSLKTTSITDTTNQSKSVPKTPFKSIQDLMKKRGCEVPSRRRRK